MGLTRIHKVLKKYRILHKKHKDSWESKQQKIRKGAPYFKTAADHALEGSKLFDAMIKDLEGQEVYSKKPLNNERG